MSNVKNYTEQGGGKWVVTGTLDIAGEGKLMIKGSDFTRATGQADSTATTVAELVTDFNLLLAKLRAAGLMEESHG